GTEACPPACPPDCGCPFADQNGAGEAAAQDRELRRVTGRWLATSRGWEDQVHGRTDHHGAQGKAATTPRRGTPAPRRREAGHRRSARGRQGGGSREGGGGARTHRRAEATRTAARATGLELARREEAAQPRGDRVVAREAAGQAPRESRIAGGGVRGERC